MTDNLLETKGLTKQFRVGKRVVDALRGVDLTIGRGEIVAVVGESGSGKTTLANLVLGLDAPTSGSILLNGEPLPAKWPRQARRRVQLVAQNPQLALNPKHKVLASVSLPLRVHGLVPRAKYRERVAELMEMVGLPAATVDRKPQVLSGGQRQRVALARAIAADPDMIVLDEPTSALDVSVQARVLQLLRELQKRLSLSYLFITHDLGVVRLVSHRVVVMLRGRIVESGPTEAIFAQPGHRYTQMLISSIPVVSREEEDAKPAWPWDRDVLTDLVSSSLGCPFRNRCPYAVEACVNVDPPMVALAPGHFARCHNPGRSPAGAPLIAEASAATPGLVTE